MLWPQGEPKDAGDKSAAVTLKFSRFTERHGTAVFLISVLAAVTSGYGISKLEVENRFIDYFHESTEIYQGMSVIDQRLGGTTTLDVIMDVVPDAAAGEGQDPFATDDPFTVDDPFATDDPFAATESDPFAADDPFAMTESDPFASEDPFAETADNNAPKRKIVIGLRVLEWKISSVCMIIWKACQ